MTPLDYFVLIVYFAGILAIGGVFARRNRTSADMFSAGGRSPWWASGLSGFMTMFSAGTFVVWGSIAFQHGLVAVTINLVYGLAALATGYFVAGRWKKLGIRTPAEFVRLRYGVTALHFYTWSMLLLRMVSVGVALYSLSVLLVALMPLAEGNPLRDPATGNLALVWAILFFGGIVVLYTMIGGLWAVLMTDVLQFIVLTLAVLVVVPLILAQAGGVGGFVAASPDDFFTLVGGGYTWFFIAGWWAIHFFMIGADWAFVQRFLCVPTARDARKGAYLFGILYLVSPLLWLLPPMIYRTINPEANPEQAYILACKLVLPAGMVGLMLAAMFSATASMVSSQLNVFAGVLTNDVYRSLRSKETGEREAVWVGRAFTVMLGGFLLALALAIPRLGGAERVIIAVTSLLVGPLLAPALWGLLSRRVTSAAVWAPVSVCFVVGLFMEFGFREGGFLAGIGWLAGVAEWVQQNPQSKNILLGVLLPVVLILLVQSFSKGTAGGWKKLMALAPDAAEKTVVEGANPVAWLVVGWSLVVCGLLVVVMILFNSTDRAILTGFGGVLFALGWLSLRMARKAGSEVAGSEVRAEPAGANRDT